VARLYANSHPEDPEGYLISIRIAHRTGQQRVVSEGLARLAALPGESARASAEGATLLASDQGPSAAIAALEQSGLDFGDPANAPALHVLLEQLAARGDHEGAERRSAAALASHPESAVLHALRARALRAAGRPPAQVREAFGRALELDPAHAPALVGLALLDAESGELDAALALYDRAAAADPDDPMPAHAAARLLLDAGRVASAEQRLTELLERHPREAVAALELAQILADRGEPLRAQELAERAAWFQTPGAGELLEQLRGAAPTAPSND
jgi:tetratricopeptide (TPR) repeat protein